MACDMTDPSSTHAHAMSRHPEVSTLEHGVWLLGLSIASATWWIIHHVAGTLMVLEMHEHLRT